MLRIILIISSLAVIVLSAGCQRETNLFRINEDYFPTPDTGSYWTYSNLQTNNHITVSVNEIDLFYEGRYCYQWIWNNENIYLWKDDNNIYSHQLRQKYFGGDGWDVENRWAPLFRLPFLNGDQWQDNFHNSINILGDIFEIEVNTEVKISLQGDVTTPASNFSNCYKITYIRNIQEQSALLGNLNEADSVYYWLAPGVGIVKFQDSTGVYSLTDYQFN
ncbi:MAG: hypothetical protein ACP5FK_03840 [bacterium]